MARRSARPVTKSFYGGARELSKNLVYCERPDFYWGELASRGRILVGANYYSSVWGREFKMGIGEETYGDFVMPILLLKPVGCGDLDVA